MCEPTTVLAAASAASSLAGADAASSAANTQANAANRATDTNLQMFNTVNSQQAPYREAGYTALNDIMGGFGHGAIASSTSGNDFYQANPDAFSAAWHKYSDPTGKYIDQSSPEYSDILGKTIADLKAQGISPSTQNAGAGTGSGVPTGYFTHQFNAADLNSNLAPNYQFIIDQGTRAVNNSNALKTGAVSGNTLQGIQDYVQGLAGNAYQSAYNNYTTNQNNIFNRLSKVAGFGSDANQTTAQTGTNLAANIGNAQMAAGQAAASGQVGVANALSGGANSALGWYALPQILNGNGTFGSGVRTSFAPNSAGTFDFSGNA